MPNNHERRPSRNSANHPSNQANKSKQPTLIEKLKQIGKTAGTIAAIGGMLYGAGATLSHMETKSVEKGQKGKIVDALSQQELEYEVIKFSYSGAKIELENGDKISLEFIRETDKDGNFQNYNHYLVGEAEAKKHINNKDLIFSVESEDGMTIDEALAGLGYGTLESNVVETGVINASENNEGMIE